MVAHLAALGGRPGLSPAPVALLPPLVAEGKITPLQARLAETVPVADD